MKNLGIIVRHLYPNASPLHDYRVEKDAGALRIAFWDEAKLGPQPTEEELIEAAPGAVGAALAETIARDNDRAELAALKAKAPREWTTEDAIRAAQILTARA